MFHGDEAPSSDRKKIQRLEPRWRALLSRGSRAPGPNLPGSPADRYFPGPDEIGSGDSKISALRPCPRMVERRGGRSVKKRKKQQKKKGLVGNERTPESFSLTHFPGTENPLRCLASDRWSARRRTGRNERIEIEHAANCSWGPRNGCAGVRVRAHRNSRRCPPTQQQPVELIPTSPLGFRPRQCAENGFTAVKNVRRK